jgi:hypothetical protein
MADFSLSKEGRYEQRGGLGTFRTEADLQSVLARIKDGLLEPHAKPLWLNLDRLEKSIANFRAEF